MRGYENIYALSETDLLLSEGDLFDKQYVLKIKDLPTEDKPRERLLKLGPASLSTSELMMVLLGTGTKKEGVASIASRVVKEYGPRALASQTDAKKMAAELNIPLVKALQIVACAELGRRFFEKNVAGPAVLRTAKAVHNYVRDMASLPKEHLRGIYLNTHYRVIHDETISIGTINANLIHPREVFKPAIEYGAVAFILVHNHPSGITRPSDADIAITEQLVAVGKIMGVHLIDHIIVGKNTFSSVEVNYN